MKKSTKIWLWIALVICIATTVMNAGYGRYPSVAVAVVAIIGLAVLLFTERKAGFILMCICYAVSFVISAVGSLNSETGVLLSLVMSLVGSLLIPGITALFLRGQWSKLK